MQSELLYKLRDALKDSGYTERVLLSVSAVSALKQGYQTPARLELDDPSESALKVLLSLFVVGIPVSGERIDRLFPELKTNGFVELGLLEETDGDYVAALSLTPVDLPTGTVWVISDLDDHLRKVQVADDFVMGVGGATRSLLNLLPSEMAGSALDIGTGSGIIAIAMAKLGARVTATDVSARALALAGQNAVLNDVAIDFRAGSLFEPVLNEKYDFIASNPPFVIPNDVHDPEYRSGGSYGEQLILDFAKSLPNHLSGNGFAAFLGNWETNRLQETLESATNVACAEITVRDFLTPVQYATTWARDGGLQAGSESAETAIDGWLNSFKSRDCDGVAMGWVQVKAGDADTPVVINNYNQDPLNTAPGVLHDTFRFAARLHALSDEELLNTRFITAGTVSEARNYKPGSADPYAISLQNTSPFRKTVQVETATAAVFGACDGALRLGDLCNAVAGIFEVDAAPLTAHVVTSFLGLSWYGFFEA